jgi:hypothetical protein
MNKWTKFGCLSLFISANVWAAEPYQLKLPIQVNVTLEAGQQTHLLNATDHQAVVEELNTLSKNIWSAYEGPALAPQCVLWVKDSMQANSTPTKLSFLDDQQGMIYVENPTAGAAGGVATGIAPQSIPNIVRLCQAYWQPAIKN